MSGPAAYLADRLKPVVGCRPGIFQRNREPPDPDAAQRAPGNGAVFVGSKGYMATTSRGEGVWLLPVSRWAEYKLPPQLLPRGVK